MDWSTFSKNIKKYRKSQKLTQEDLANKLGISRSTLSYYEHGNIEPNIFVLITLSKLMNCSIDSLIGLSKKRKVQDPSIPDESNYKLEESENKNNENFKLEIEEIREERQKILEKTKRSFTELEMSKKRADRMYNEFEMSKKRADRMYNEFETSKRQVDRIINQLETSKKRLDKMLEELEMSKKRTDYMYKELFRTINREKTIDNSILKLDNLEKERKLDILKAEAIDDNYIGFIKLNILGKISAGLPHYACEDLIDTVYLPNQFFKPNFEYFGLKIFGDSMNKMFDNDFTIIVRKTNSFINGDIVVAIIGDEATCKEIKQVANYIYLIPHSTNPEHQIQKYKADQVMILGVVEQTIKSILDKIDI